MFKIFYKKEYLEVLEEKIRIQEEFRRYKEDTANSMRVLEDRSFRLLEENSLLKNMKLNIEAVKEDLKKANASKGGYVKENNKLKKEKEQLEKEIADLKAQITDLKSDRYLVRKIPSGRPHKGLKTKINDSSKESKIIKKVREK